MKSMTVTTVIASVFLGGAALAQTDAPEAAQSAPSGDRAATFIERFDGNGDGAVTAEEIEAYRLRHFTAADGDGDGKLSAAEFAEMRRLADAEREEARAERLIERLDQDGDGMLSAEELPAGPHGMGHFGKSGGDSDREKRGVDRHKHNPHGMHHHGAMDRH